MKKDTTILKKITCNEMRELEDERVKQAMREQSVDFVMWCVKEYCPSTEQCVIFLTKGTYQNNKRVYTTTELYEIFNNLI